jgi:hypothetical protein
MSLTISPHAYEVRPRKDNRGVDLISDTLPFGRLWYGRPEAVANAIGYAKHRSRSHHAVIRVCDDAGNVIETHEHKGNFKEPLKSQLPYARPCEIEGRLRPRRSGNFALRIP